MANLIILGVFAAVHQVNKGVDPHADVIVYGGTPAGCVAAIAAARTLAGSVGSVLLLEPSPYRVGGMTAGGLGNTDLGLGGRELGGITREFYERVSAYYSTDELHGGQGRRRFQITWITVSSSENIHVQCLNNWNHLV